MGEWVGRRWGGCASEHADVYTLLWKGAEPEGRLAGGWVDECGWVSERGHTIHRFAIPTD
jgi:hypothetical protein